MSSLFIIYDVDKKHITSASIGGKFLHGLSSIVLGNGKMTLRDLNGRDPLKEPSGDGESASNATDDESELSEAHLAIARAFGFKDGTQGDEGQRS